VVLNLTERQKEVATGLFVLVLVVAGIGGGEVSLRLLNLIRFGNSTGELAVVTKQERIYIDEVTGLRRQKPGQYGRIRINSLGFRGSEIDVPKPSDTYRLAFLGASVVYDPYVRDDRIWPLLTSQRLDAQFENCRVDVVNGSAPGYGTVHIKSLYENYIAPLTPDAVVIYTSDFNIDTKKLVEKDASGLVTEYRRSWLAERSLFWAKVEKNIYSLRLMRNVHNPEGKLQFDERELPKKFEDRLTALVQSVKNSGAKVILLSRVGQLSENQSKSAQEKAVVSTVLYMSYMSVEGLLRGRRAYNDTIRRVARATDVAFIDTSDALSATPDFFADSIHFTERGSSRFSKFLSTKLDALLSPERCQ